VLSLDDCLRMARENNHSRPASQFAVAMAEAQHRQALAGYWPQVSVKGGITAMEHPLDFAYPAGEMYIPAQSVAIPGGSATVSIPANAFGPGFPPVAVQLPVSYPGQTVNTNPQLFPIPAQDIKLLGKATEAMQGDFKWLLADGGMRHGYSEQAMGGVDAAKAEARRTDLELTDSVVRIYYGAVLARQLRQLGDDTLERMEATLRVTETLYKEGSGSVTKADFLDNLVMVDSLRSIVGPLEENESSAEAALAYTLGLSWKSSVEPRDGEIPYLPYAGNLDAMVTTAYEFNPDWNKLQAGLRSYEGERLTASSGHYPKLALTGNLHRMWNSYEGGVNTPDNRSGWTVGAGVEIPIFDGFLTSAKVAEAQAKINKLKQEKMLLREGIGLQIRTLFLSLSAAEKSYRASADAMKAAGDDRDLTTRAYASGLVDTARVIRVQLQEAMVSAAFYKSAYDHRVLESKIDLVVGKEMQSQIDAVH
jgi:outer membrane protein TolC